MEIQFTKMQGTGNDFIIIDDRKEIIGETGYPELSRNLCSRHFGIGGDGIILILNPSDGALLKHDIRFRIFNSDGSEAQMCGNGIRCFAKYLYEKRINDSKKMRVETKAGTIVPEVIADGNDRVTSVKVDMGKPVLTCSEIPCHSSGLQSGAEHLDLLERQFTMVPVGMGNPHCVIFVDDIDTIDLAVLGPLVEHDERFPEKTNVEFIQILSPQEIIMKVWERGAGITLACGTGACASVVAANIAGKGNRKSTVHLDGGDLEIVWDEQTGHIFKTGPAEEVFTGTLRNPYRLIR